MRVIVEEIESSCQLDVNVTNEPNVNVSNIVDVNVTNTPLEVSN